MTTHRNLSREELERRIADNRRDVDLLRKRRQQQVEELFGLDNRRMSKHSPAYQAMRKEISWAWGRMFQLNDEIQLCQDEIDRRESTGES